MVAWAQNEPYYGKVVEAHGILGPLAWVIFFPLSAILIRVMPTRWAWLSHASVALLALALFTANFGMGIWITLGINEAHMYLGVLIFSLAWTQPFTGLTHHNITKKIGRRSFLSFLHIFFGRVLITIGMINGGLGILLAGNTTRAENIAYGTVAGIVWLTYIIIAFWGEAEREKEKFKPVSEDGKVYESYASS